MNLPLPSTPCTVFVFARFGLRAGSRTERWLRLFAWQGNVDHPAWEPADPCRAHSGLYCEAPGEGAPKWLPPLAGSRPPDKAVRAWAQDVVIPWSERFLQMAPHLTAAAKDFSAGRFALLTVELEARLPLNPGGMATDRAAVILREASKPGRILLRAARWRDGAVRCNTRADALVSWGRRDTPEWAALRGQLAAGFDRALKDLLVEARP